MDELIFNVGESDFEERVIERSNRVPVVVDFWAEWCGPCKALGPILERIIAEYQGEVVLAKVDVDQAPQLAAAFGARSIPMVLGFRDGGIAAEFVGALPEPQVREFFTRLLPSEAEKLAARAVQMREAGNNEDAVETLRLAIDKDPRCETAILELARILVEAGDVDEAPQLLDRIGPGTPLRQEADRLAAALRVFGSEDVDEKALLAKIGANPDDHESRFALAGSLAGAARYDEALDQYLEIVKRDRAFRDDGARKAMIDIFEILGSDDEITERFRSKLAKVLFS
jgi:putative thioredoxin